MTNISINIFNNDKNLKVLNILFFKFQTQLFKIFTNYENDNIKERKIMSQML